MLACSNKTGNSKQTKKKNCSCGTKPLLNNSINCDTTLFENEPNVILGSLQFKLKKNDPKVVYLKTLTQLKNINKEFKSEKSDEAEYFNTYLGQIKLIEKEWHVFKQFYTIQAAIVKHGQSVIIFMDRQGAAYYDMELPEDLPIDMKNGSFRFKYKNDTLLMKIEYPNKLVLNLLMYSRLFNKREFTVNIMYVDNKKGEQMLEAWKKSKFTHKLH
ncbi:MAG: hypothetical protein RIS20_349 [Bacteroidota bacterium]